MAPNTYEDWVEVAQERLADARAMLPVRDGKVGPVYMAGYAVECSLKAFLQRRNKSYPRRGAEGHDLRGLWQAAGFRHSDLKDQIGKKTFYIDFWSTNLRYETYVNSSISVNDLIQGASQMAGWIHQLTRRRYR